MECRRCSKFQLTGPCARKGCSDRGTRIRTVAGNFKLTCDKHTPCCRGSGIVPVFEVWFVQNSGKRTQIEASSRKEAIRIFADAEGIAVSSYIQARKVS